MTLQGHLSYRVGGSDRPNVDGSEIRRSAPGMVKTLKRYGIIIILGGEPDFGTINSIPLKIGPNCPQKVAGSSSNHPVSVAFAVSFREGMPH